MNIHFFAVECNGRHVDGRSVLADAVEVELKVAKLEDRKTLSVSVSDCRYIDGPNKNLCKASRKSGATCPYVVVFPGPPWTGG